jgi:hypothetical protein
VFVCCCGQTHPQQPLMQVSKKRMNLKKILDLQVAPIPQHQLNKKIYCQILKMLLIEIKVFVFID